MQKTEWKKYRDIHLLVEQKKRLNETISVIIPTLNEEKCVATIIRALQKTVMGNIGLVDEIIVMDGGSTDRTQKEVEQCGVRFVSCPNETPSRFPGGKGLALWYAQFVAVGSIICYVDADIENFDERFVVGLVGPLLEDRAIGFTKAFYTRPLSIGNTQDKEGGGRVTELLIRPLLARFYPAASEFIQPLSGEYAFRTTFLSKLRFSTSYAVETVLILEYLKHFASTTIVQVDMDERVHQNQSLANLSKMSAAILDHFALLAKEDGLWCSAGENSFISVKNQKINKEDISQVMLPPFEDSGEYGN